MSTVFLSRTFLLEKGAGYTVVGYRIPERILKGGSCHFRLENISVDAHKLAVCWTL